MTTARTARRREDSKFRGTAWASVAFLAFAVIGWVAPHHADPVDDCTVVTRRTDINPDAYTALQARGYTVEGDTLRSPGCGGQ